MNQLLTVSCLTILGPRLFEIPGPCCQVEVGISFRISEISGQRRRLGAARLLEIEGRHPRLNIFRSREIGRITTNVNRVCRLINAGVVYVHCSRELEVLKVDR